MADSTTKRKPAKPYPDFPLFAHATKRWAKKIRGRLHYFGPWDDPDGALQRYLDQRDDLHAGRVPRAKQAGLTLATLANLFLDAKKRQEDRGELAHSTWVSLRRTCKWLLATLGRDRLADDVAPEDFTRLRASLEGMAPNTQRGRIMEARALFQFAVRQKIVAELPTFGDDFKAPSKRILRQHKQANGGLVFSRGEILAVLEAADPLLRAATLLGINCAYGQQDVASLPLGALQDDWATFPRPKTAVDRRCWAWPETREAIADSLADRPKPRRAEYSGLVFLAKDGLPLIRTEADIKSDLLGARFNRLLRKLGIKRPGVGFYTLRRTHRIVTDECRDPTACDVIMGHEGSDMGSLYRQGIISDDRLQAVSEHVRQWVFGNQDQG